MFELNKEVKSVQMSCVGNIKNLSVREMRSYFKIPGYEVKKMNSKECTFTIKKQTNYY